jgi:hypothetical protein
MKVQVREQIRLRKRRLRGSEAPRPGALMTAAGPALPPGGPHRAMIAEACRRRGVSACYVR